MVMQTEREMVVACGKKLLDTGLVTGTFGNISVYDPETGRMAITPSGMDYTALTPADIVVLTPEGERVEGERKPSSEYDLHRIFYRRRPEVRAVVHTHSTYASALACLNWSIPPLHYLVAYAGRDVPCIPYVKIGTYALAEAAYTGMGDRYACLLGNHGLLAVGPHLDYAFDVAEQIEFVAKMYYMTKAVGEPVLLTDDQVTEMLDGFKDYHKR